MLDKTTPRAKSRCASRNQRAEFAFRCYDDEHLPIAIFDLSDLLLKT